MLPIRGGLCSNGFMKLASHRLALIGLASLLLAASLAGACGKDDDPIPTTRGQACDIAAACLGGDACCIADGEVTGVCQPTCDCVTFCQGFKPPTATVGVCCTNSCAYVFPAGEQGSWCVSTEDCAAPLTCVDRGDGCVGFCTQPGTGGAGGGAPAAIPPNSVVSGDVSTDANGCIFSSGVGATPGHIALDTTFTGPRTVTVSGMLTPVDQGVGIDGVSTVQVCNGGMINGSTVEGCHLGRVTQNTLNGQGSISIFDVLFAEVATDSWTPSSTTHSFVLTIVSDPDAQTLSVTLTIDGSQVATTSASSLGLPGGAVISVLIAQAKVCSIDVMQ